MASESSFGSKYKKNAMFLCNHNSCRSQMAEGWMRHLKPDDIGVASSGIVRCSSLFEPLELL